MAIKSARKDLKVVKVKTINSLNDPKDEANILIKEENKGDNVSNEGILNFRGKCVFHTVG